MSHSHSLGGTVPQRYLLPATLSSAQELARLSDGQFRYLAGGTDLMHNRAQGNGVAPCLIDISGIEELRGIRIEGDRLRIGALERLCDLNRSAEVTDRFPMLAEAALTVGSPLIRNAATLGGNLLCENRCLFYNQSEWWRDAIGRCLKCEGDICIATKGKKACFSEMVSDTAPALIAMDAEVEIATAAGRQIRPLESIYTGDGARPHDLGDPTALITAIMLPLNRIFRAVFSKLRERQSLEFTALTTAIAIDAKGHLKVAISGVDPAPVVIRGNWDDDPVALVRKAVKGARTVDNDMFPRNYRRDMIKEYLNRGLSRLNES